VTAAYRKALDAACAVMPGWIRLSTGFLLQGLEKKVVPENGEVGFNWMISFLVNRKAVTG